MRRQFLVALVVALVVGIVSAEAQARPGGGKRGGARVGGGGIRSGGVRPGNLGGGQIGQQGIRNFGGQLQSPAGNVAGNLQKGTFQNKVSQLKTSFTPQNQPFTPAWYADHPRAWQYTHPHADAWAVATFGTAAAWLGLAAITDGTVYTAETAEAEAADDETQDEQSENEPAGGEFLPLGVFALAPKNERAATAVVQLAVNRNGDLRGNYYDVASGLDQAIAGSINKQTQRAAFQVGPKGNVSFETTLASLTQPNGTVTLRSAGGQAREWTLARFDDPQTQTN